MKAYSLFKKGDIIYVEKDINNATNSLKPDTYIVIKQYPSRRIELLGVNSISFTTITTVFTEDDMANKIIKEGNVLQAFKEMINEVIPKCFMYLLNNPDKDYLPLDFSYCISHACTSCMSNISEIERLVASNLCEIIFDCSDEQDSSSALPSFSDMRTRFNTLKAALL